MASLLGDGWFYISAGGFLVSSMLFVFFLGQYRAAVEAEDEAESSELPQPIPVMAAAPAEKVYIPKAAAFDPLPAVLPQPAPKPAVVAAPPAPAEEKPAPKAAEHKKSGLTTTSGISPAVVYLQNLKGQMERLDKDIVNLKALASQQTAQSDGILKALAGLTRKIDELAQRPAAAAAAPNAAPAQTAEAAAASAPEAAPEPQPAPEPEPEPQPEPAAAAPPNELKVDVPPSQPVSQPVAAASAAAAAEPSPEAPARPSRKGPVWPI